MSSRKQLLYCKCEFYVDQILAQRGRERARLWFPSRAIRIFTTEAGGASDLPARLLFAGSAVVASTPGEAVAIIKSETGRIRKLINAAGLKE